MTNEQREFHGRMNGDIEEALAQLFHQFDIRKEDRAQDAADWEILRADLKGLLFKAYERNHSWITEAA